MISLKSLLLEVSVEDLRRQFVDTGKISEKTFDAIVDIAGGKSAYATWLCKRLVTDNSRVEILINDMSRTLKGALDFFDKNKRLFTDKDINRYEDLTDFITLCMDKSKELEASKQQKDINRFKIGAVETADGTGYLVYKLPKGHEENQPVAIALGRHPEGYRGWCTSYDGNARWWSEHIQKEDLYIFVNPKASATDKYQIQFGYNDARPFSIKDDSPLMDSDIVPNLVPFYKFLHDREGRPMPDYVVSEEDFLNQVNESKGTLEDLRVEPDIYKIDSDTDLDLWIGPFCRDILEYANKTAVSLIRSRLESAEGYAYYFVRAHGMWFSIYTMSTPSEGRILQRSRLDSYIHNAIKAAEDSSFPELYERCKRVAELISCSLPVELILKYESDSLPSLKEFYKGKVGKIEYYIVPGGTSLYRIFRDLEFEDWKWKAIGTGRHAIGILIQGKDVVLLHGLDESTRHLPTIERYKDGQKSKQTDYNPDIMYEMYKNLKSFDDSVRLPSKLQKIDDIRKGSLDDFKVPQIGAVKALYKVPARHCPLIPYDVEPPYSVEEGSYTLLGFISKWQFTLSSRGGFSLTGRWGSGNSSSWIASVKGLPETLQSICKEYGIRRPDGLVEYLRRYGQES